MKQYTMNKEVRHNGKLYAKGVVITKSDEGFDELVKAGHADGVEFKGMPEAAAAPEAQPEAAAEGESEEHEEGSSKRRGRNR